jgi:hypothetical protein
MKLHNPDGRVSCLASFEAVFPIYAIQVQPYLYGFPDKSVHENWYFGLRNVGF